MAKNTQKGQKRAERFKKNHGMKKSEWTDLKRKLRKDGKASEINKILKK